MEPHPPRRTDVIRRRAGRLWALLAPVALTLSGAAALPALVLPGSGLLAQETDPLEVVVSYEPEPSGVRVTVGLSRAVEYRFEESRSRLRLMILEPISEDSYVDRDVDFDVLRRIRFDETSRGADIVFYLGREFETFDTEELDQPFRVVLHLARRGAAPGPAPGGTTAQPPAGVPPEGGEPLPPGLVIDDPGAPRVVIDPGHGGDETGAVSSSGLKEKDLVLDIAEKLRDRLRGSGFSVTMTRDDDQGVDLMKRTAIANSARADLFLSIHANASQRSAARGAETYFLSYGTDDQEAMSLAAQENRGAGRAGPDAGGRDGEISLVLWDMAQVAWLSQSSQLAGLIQAEMNALGGIRDRGVKQAPFRVLVGATMPAVLVEVGFLSHGQEEKKLASPEYREQIAVALAAALEKFRRGEVQENAGLATGVPAGPRR